MCVTVLYVQEKSKNSSDFKSVYVFEVSGLRSNYFCISF
jgi:hypothetical protein